MSPFQIPFAISHTQERFLAKLSCQIGEVLIDLALEWGGVQPWPRKGIIGPLNGSPKPCQTEFSRLPGGLGHFADSNSIPQNQPTIFHSILIVTVLLKLLLLLFVPRFQQYHLSRIDEVSRFDVSTIFLHRIFQIPFNCQVKKKKLLASTVRDIFVNSFPSPEFFCFARKSLDPLSGKILYHDSVPVIVSCFLIKDFVISRYQVTKLFCSRYCFASASSARSLCNFGTQEGIATSVFWEASIKTMLP